MILNITPGAELPDRGIFWEQESPSGVVEPVDFVASPHTFRLVISFPSPVTKTTGITGDADGVVTIAFDAAETDAYPLGNFEARLWAKRSLDDKDREPIRLDVHVQD